MKTANENDTSIEISIERTDPIDRLLDSFENHYENIDEDSRDLQDSP